MRPLLVVVLLVAACGAKVIVDRGPAGSGGATSTGPSTGSVGACPDGGMPIPAQLKACTTKDDCTELYIYIDCCGREEAIGVAYSQVDAFDAFEKACNEVVPACGCDPGLTLAEDGKEAVAGGVILTACNVGLCSTFVP